MITSPPFDSATVDPSVQEALSIRYGASAFMVVPLSTGRIAVLGHYRELHSIVDTWEEACESARTIQMNQWRRNLEKARAPDDRKAPATKKDQLDELTSLMGL